MDIPETDEDSKVKMYVVARNNGLARIFLYKNYFCIVSNEVRYFERYEKTDEYKMICDLLSYGIYLMGEIKEILSTGKTWCELLFCKLVDREDVPFELRDRIMVEEL